MRVCAVTTNQGRAYALVRMYQNKRDNKLSWDVESHREQRETSGKWIWPQVQPHGPWIASTRAMGAWGGMSPVGSGSSVRDDGKSCHGSSGKVGSSGRSAPRGLVRRIRSGAGISKQRLPHTIQLFDSTLPLAIARREQQGGKSSDRTAGTAVVSSACRVAITSARHFDWPQRVIKPLSSLAASASRAQLVIWSVNH